MGHLYDLRYYMGRDMEPPETEALMGWTTDFEDQLRNLLEPAWDSRELVRVQVNLGPAKEHERIEGRSYEPECTELG